MLMVIIGAGASYDCDLDELARDQRPPLASDLVSERYANVIEAFPLCASLVDRVRGAMERGASLEHALQEIRNESERVPRLAVQLMAFRYYLKAVLKQESESHAIRNGGISTYVSLARQVEDWRDASKSRVLWTTFNYDTLLEAALRRDPGLRFGGMDDYLGDEHSVIKVHGSWDWGQGIDVPSLWRTTGADRESVMRGAAQAKAFDRFDRAESFDAVEVDGVLMAPAIAIPVETKSQSEFACPSAHLVRMRKWMSRCNHVLAIGWRGEEEHFLAELRAHANSQASVSVVVGEYRARWKAEAACCGDM
jgi:hypothetical protein